MTLLECLTHKEALNVFTNAYKIKQTFSVENVGFTAVVNLISTMQKLQLNKFFLPLMQLDSHSLTQMHRVYNAKGTFTYNTN